MAGKINYLKLKTILLKNPNVVSVWKKDGDTIGLTINGSIYKDKESFWKDIFDEKFIYDKTLKTYLDKHIEIKEKDLRDYIAYYNAILFYNNVMSEEVIVDLDVKERVIFLYFRIKEYF